LARHPAVTDVAAIAQNGERRLAATVSGDDTVLSALLGDLVGDGFPVLEFHEQTGDLEDAFMRLTQGLVT
jgi:hypothetical protein